MDFGLLGGFFGAEFGNFQAWRPMPGIVGPEIKVAHSEAPRGVVGPCIVPICVVPPTYRISDQKAAGGRRKSQKGRFEHPRGDFSCC